ncbi:hypothetical protein SB748_25630 [Rhizobium sp. SIMBA_035]
MVQAFDKRGKQPLGPDEISMIHGLIKDHCRERALEPGGQEAQEAAKKLLGWFQAGITGQNRLRQLLGGQARNASGVAEDCSI